MLRSWISARRSWFDVTRSAGLFIGRDRVGCTLLEKTNGVWRLQEVTEVALSQPLFNGPPAPNAAMLLAEALEKLSKSISRRYLPVHVSLADAAARTEIFELDTLPKRRAAQLEFIRWRFTRDAAM